MATFEVIGQAPDTVVPAASVEPAVATAGTTLSFRATGFKKREHISWWVTAPDTTIREGGPDAVKADSKARSRSAGRCWPMRNQVAGL